MGASLEPEPDSGDQQVPYRPSWANIISLWAVRLPGPTWAYYLGLWLFLVLVQIIILKLEGAVPLEVYHSAQAFLAGTIAFMLGTFPYFDLRAAHALTLIRPVLTLNKEQFRDLEYRLTQLPALWSITASVVAVGLLLLTESLGTAYWLESLASYPISALLLRVVYFISWGVFGLLVYQTLHRFVLINKIYSQYTQINLFRKQPLYALSSLAAWMAVSLTILPIGFLLSNEIFSLTSLDRIAIIVVLGIQAVAFLSFIWPQLGIQRIQRREKDRLLDEVNLRYETIYRELHRRIDAGDLTETGNLATTVSLLQMELDRVKGIPVWPWDPETLRWLVTALVLPLIIMVLQIVLQRIL